MSFVLKTGFRLDRAATLDAAYSWASALRMEISARGRARDADLLADHAIRRIDLAATLALRPGERTRDPGNPLSAARAEIRGRRRQIRETGCRDPEVDLDFTVTLHPREGAIYGICHSEQSDWIRLVLDTEAVTPLPYWDNTDRPGDVATADWAARRDLWTAILSGDRFGRPSHCGLTVEMTPFPVDPGIEEVVAAQPGFPERLARTARDCAIHVLSGAERQTDPQDGMRAVIAAISTLHEESGQAVMSEMSEKCADLILARIEKSHLLGEAG